MKINDNLLLAIGIFIMSLAPSSRAEIPFGDAFGVYSSSRDEYKKISPFWGMVGLHSDVIKKFRLFGFYETVSLVGGEQQEQSLDAISELIKRLFPSPDGVQFVANSLKEDPAGDLGRNLGAMDSIIRHLINDNNDDDKNNAIRFVLESIQINLSPNKMKAYTEKQGQFSHLLVTAYNEQKKYANKENILDQRYPENIVIISLLTFFAKVADSKHDFKKLPSLFKDYDFLENNSFNSDDYFSGVAEFKNNILKTLEEDVEKSFLYLFGFNKYEISYGKPFSYKGGVCIEGVKGEPFSDCGETSLKNILFIAQGEGLENIYEKFDRLKHKLKLPSGYNLAESPFNDMVTHFKNYPSLERASTERAHNDWAKVIFNLNQGLDKSNPLQLIQYGKGKSTYELKSNISPIGVNGIINMFNAISIIIPDEILRAPWPTDEKKSFDRAIGFDMVSQKLDRFFELLSSDNKKISWEDAGTKDKKIRDQFLEITIKINNIPAYRWKFVPGHFQITPLFIPANDWRVGFQDIFEKIDNEWMQALNAKLPVNPEKIMKKDYGAGYPWAWLFGNKADLDDLDSVIRAISFVFYQNHTYDQLGQFLPVIKNWINKSIILTDEHSLESISLLTLVASKVEQLGSIGHEIMEKFPLIGQRVKLLAKRPTDLNQLAADLIRNNLILALMILADSGNNDAISELDLKMDYFITDGILKNFTKLKSLILGDNNTISDDGIKGLVNLTSLDLSGNYVITDDGIKDLVNLTNLDLSYGSINITKDGLKELVNLTSLGLKYNRGITDGSLKELVNLTRLDLSFNEKITNDDLKTLTKLTELNLSANEKITNDGIKDLVNLTSLDLSYNAEITDDGVKNLVNLRILDLKGNSNISLDALRNLPNLKAISLEKNSFIRELFLKNLPRIQILD